jgi:putative cardiolipin synthase
MLLDDYWQAGRDRRLAGIGAHPNIELRVFNPVGGDRVHEFSRSLHYAFGPKRIRGRMHNKSLIVDAAAVVVGGRNIADEYFAANREYNFGDVDMVVIGQAVRDVSETFDQYWNAPLALPIEAFVSAKQGAECLAEVRARLEQARGPAKESVYAQRMRESDLLALVQARKVPFLWGKDEALADAPGKSLLKRAEAPEAFMAVRLLAVMSAAKREVLMVSPYFVPGKAGIEWFNDARARGVTVKVVTNSLASTDVFAAQGGYSSYRKAVLRAGVDLFELRPDPERTGKSAELYRGSTSRAALHAKILVIDRETIFVGSHNIDPRSGQLDSQNGILIQSLELAAQLASVFDQVTTPAYTYRVSLDGNKVKWTTEKNGKRVTYTNDPETSGWRRFKSTILGTLSPEQWL